MKGTEIIAFLSNGLKSMSSAVAPVVGALFTAIFLRHDTKTREFEQIKAGKFKEVVDELLASGKMTYMEYYKANNFLTIAKKADYYYREHPRTDEKGCYDFDWFVRFFEAVGNVSDDEIQNLWAKILAEEIARPSTFSLKTIDVMRNMCKRDAELFIKICSHSFMSGPQNYFLPNDEIFLEAVGITYTDIMKLSELGLIFNNGTITWNMDISNKPAILISNTSLIMMISSASGNPEKASIGQYPFTEVGKEITTLINKTAQNEDFLKYGEVLSHNKQYKISVNKIIERIGNFVQYNETNLIPQDQSLTNSD